MSDFRQIVFEGWLRDLAASAATPRAKAEAVASVFRFVADTMLSTTDQRADVALGFAIGCAVRAGHPLVRLTATARRFWPTAVQRIADSNRQAAAQIVAGAFEEMRRG